MPDELSNIASAMRDEQQVVTKLPSRKRAALLLLIVAWDCSCAFADSIELVLTKMKSTRFKRPAPISMATSRSTANIPC